MSDDNTETVPGRLQEMYKERRKVRIDPTINYGHLISAGVSLVSAAAFVITGWALMDKRVVVLEEAKTYQTQRDLAQDQAVRDKFETLIKSMDKMEVSINELRRDLRERK